MDVLNGYRGICITILWIQVLYTVQYNIIIIMNSDFGNKLTPSMYIEKKGRKAFSILSNSSSILLSSRTETTHSLTHSAVLLAVDAACSFQRWIEKNHRQILRTVHYAFIVLPGPTDRQSVSKYKLIRTVSM